MAGDGPGLAAWSSHLRFGSCRPTSVIRAPRSTSQKGTRYLVPFSTGIDGQRNLACRPLPLPDLLERRSPLSLLYRFQQMYGSIANLPTVFCSDLGRIAKVEANEDA